MPTPARYWVRLNDKNLGPFSPEEIRRRADVTDTTMVCPAGAKGGSDWKEVREVPELRPMPPVQPEPPPPTQREPTSSRFRWMLAVLFFALAAGGGAFAYWRHHRATPMGVALRYLEALKAGEHRTAYDLMTRASQAHIESTAFEAYQRRAGAREWSFADVTVTGQTADWVDFEWAAVVGGTKTPNALRLALDRKQWRVAHTATLEAQGQEAGAREDFAGQMAIIRRLLEINPRSEYFDAWLTRATVNAAVHMPLGPGRDLAIREAVEIARASAKRLGETYRSHMTLGVALGNAGLGEDAVTTYGWAFDQAEDPDEKARALVARAEIYMGINQPLLAFDDIKAAKKLDPENVKVQQFETVLRRMGGPRFED